jgi:hypothetical protein
MEIITSIQNRIYEIRGERVMLDRDLATLYETETKRLKEAVKRNMSRFSKDFMFQLTAVEFKAIKPQLDLVEVPDSLRTQIATSKRGGNRYLPFAFTEQGVAMLSAVINSEKAINMNIAIMRAFVDIRKMRAQKNDSRNQLKQIMDRLREHDVQLSQIYESLENLLDEKAAERKWEERERIGFRH